MRDCLMEESFLSANKVEILTACVEDAADEISDLDPYWVSGVLNCLDEKINQKEVEFTAFLGSGDQDLPDDRLTRQDQRLFANSLSACVDDLSGEDREAFIRGVEYHIRPSCNTTNGFKGIFRDIWPKK